MTPKDASAFAREICGRAPVIPVMVIEDAAHAAPLARALVAGGLPVLEVTLRTPAAIEAISEMAGVEGGIVGAGTLLTPADVRAAKDAGARFGVSPGVTQALVDACADADLPLLGGVATVTEAMEMLARGYDMVKFFPAEANGGAPALKAFAGPLPQVGFCPTGGVTAQNAPAYLALPNVICVGGSWVADAALMRDGDWEGITKIARDASQLRG